ncbi:hypothetical protein BCR44DRAFT_1436777 [Catenaria anguillulae PL171]|uniref:Uncharacterized protein n=1 Tax=Catenaria anguillulae PL171 TaxID=765915 RepID=A0A1Y2HM80_9FUNG|nr:hypothetical protein BCR44DRAFT_1436777 [Catenaria anguillulae PL171]
MAMREQTASTTRLKTLSRPFFPARQTLRRSTRTRFSISLSRPRIVITSSFPMSKKCGLYARQRHSSPRLLGYPPILLFPTLLCPLNPSPST